MESKRRGNPIDLLRRAFQKAVVGRLRYGRGDDYDAAAYWEDRFKRYGYSLKGAGHEGLSEEANTGMYEEAAEVFTDLCRKESVDFEAVRVLDIGCGNGFYTKLLHELGVKRYLGLDITDTLFPSLRESYPQFEFVREDITSDKLSGEFDLILMIDVVEHIVKESRLAQAMENVRDCLSSGGLFVVSGIRRVSRRRLFYVRSWSAEDIKKEFSGYSVSEPLAFRDALILSIRKP